MSSLCSVAVLLSCLVLLFLAKESLSHPLSAPLTLKQPLSFCQFNGSVCCNSHEDLKLQKQFKAVNVSGSCSSHLKSLLCSKCDPFAAELFRAELESRQVPVLCNSTVSSHKSTQSLADIDFCTRFWSECQNLSVTNTPFASQSGDGGNSTIYEIWKSRNDFCKTFGGSSDESSVCFNGQAVSFNISKATSPSPSGICLEKLANGSFLNMEPHPDGSNRVFLSDQAGMIYLATVPSQGSREVLTIDETNLFLDLTEEVHFDAELGLLGIAFHPDFLRNGRFFVSFNCDRVKWPECSGKCACNSDVDCDPSKLDSDDGATPCQYHSVISEFFTNGTYVKPVEVRRILTMGLPFASHHGGQILFGPKDGYLYFMMGDGGSKGDPHNFAQNKRSLLGKIMRLDVNNVPGISLQTYTLESFGVELKLHWVVETSRALVFHYDAPRIRRSLAHLIQTLHHHHHHLHPLALYSPLDKTTTKTSTYLQALAFTESFVRAAVTSIALLKTELHWFLHDSLIVLRHLHHHLNDYTTALVLL
ncbi:hypothetical protein YC2023_077207 [Brassica napus]